MTKTVFASNVAVPTRDFDRKACHLEAPVEQSSLVICANRAWDVSGRVPTAGLGLLRPKSKQYDKHFIAALQRVHWTPRSPSRRESPSGFVGCDKRTSDRCNKTDKLHAKSNRFAQSNARAQNRSGRSVAPIITLKYPIVLNLSVVSAEDNRREMLERELELTRCAAALQAAVNAAMLEHKPRPSFLDLSELRRLSQAGVPESELSELREYMADVSTAEVLELMDYAFASSRGDLQEKAALIAEFHQRWSRDQTSEEWVNYEDVRRYDKIIRPYTAVEGFALVAIATPPSEPSEPSEHNSYSQMLNDILKPVPSCELNANASLPPDACSDREVLLEKVE
jgi:hypothetical protein